MATLSWGSTGPDVERLQQVLMAGGYYYGAVDGVFGPLTYAAVRRLQQAHGLSVDGVVGPQTHSVLATLGAPVVQPSPGTPIAGPGPRGLSLHIGINRVDPAKYGGWDGALAGCERDARTMAAIAQAEGFTTTSLIAPQATAERILSEIRQAARQLGSAGTFLLTYAGHGGQVADLGGDEEADRKDETWVAYDRQIIDDEIWQALSEFAAGVDVVMVSDSCHSGSVHRFVADEVLDRDYSEQFSVLKKAYYQDLAAARPGPGEPPFVAFPRPRSTVMSARAAVPVHGRAQRTAMATAAVAREVTTTSFAPPPLLVSEAPVNGGTAQTRELPFGENAAANDIQWPELVEAKRRTGSRGTSGDVRASGLLLSGCADNQLSQEVGGAGVFTTTLNRVWAGGTYAGDYQRFMALVVSQMGPTQTPQITGFGASFAGLQSKTPFSPR